MTIAVVIRPTLKSMIFSFEGMTRENREEMVANYTKVAVKLCKLLSQRFPALERRLKSLK